MSSIIQASMSVSLSSTKRVSTGDPTSSTPSQTLNLNTILPAAFAQSWTQSTSPDGQDAWSGQVPLSGGVATIDLTNLTQAGIAAPVNASGLHLRAIVVLAAAANANPIQIGTGASNGYSGIGVISGLKAGNIALRTCAGSIAIDGTHKTLDLVGTGSEVLNILMIFGT